MPRFDKRKNKNNTQEEESKSSRPFNESFKKEVVALFDSNMVTGERGDYEESIIGPRGINTELRKNAIIIKDVRGVIHRIKFKNAKYGIICVHGNVSDRGLDSKDKSESYHSVLNIPDQLVEFLDAGIIHCDMTTCFGSSVLQYLAEICSYFEGLSLCIYSSSKYPTSTKDHTAYTIGNSLEDALCGSKKDQMKIISKRMLDHTFPVAETVNFVKVIGGNFIAMKITNPKYYELHAWESPEALIKYYREEAIKPVLSNRTDNQSHIGIPLTDPNDLDYKQLEKVILEGLEEGLKELENSKHKRDSFFKEMLFASWIKATSNDNLPVFRKLNKIKNDLYGIDLERDIYNLGGNETLLHIAVKNDSRKILPILIDSGINLEVKNITDGNTVLDIAISKRNMDFANILINKGAKINKRLAEGCLKELFDSAVETNSDQAIKEILKIGMDLILETKSANSIIEFAQGNIEPNKLLENLDLRYDIFIDRENEKISNIFEESYKEFIEERSRKTPIEIAAISNNTSTIAKLLSMDAIIEDIEGVNLTDKDGNAPLAHAIQNGDKDVVRLLIENNADVNQKYEDGYTALHLVLITEKMPIIKLILNNGADVNQKNNDGETPLDMARECLSGKDLDFVINEIAKIPNVSPRIKQDSERLFQDDSKEIG